jgi:hypothetical protein
VPARVVLDNPETVVMESDFHDKGISEGDQPRDPFQEKTEPHIKHAKQLAQTSLEAATFL